ncbi:hypothetical protein [Actinoplanes sp. L3-i22]|uniref:hypothetical protein n=1 Tax=Actinoplanes sp. L3-i22 TaxID=2836373 RepID=UPI001C74BBAD|nr:hypothetical protein [Actinoplanes sp. L3-i22]BCY11906.1 hypothetical protein L3i22_069940 [Actinoplanes sp. L3-i22]
MSHDYFGSAGGEHDYDVATRIEVHGAELDTAVTALQTQAKAVADSISSINGGLSGLKLSWAGASQREATDFIDRWNAIAVALFGTKAANDDKDFDAEDGVLNVLAAGVKAVLAGFNEAETELLKNFTDMFNGLNGTATPTPAPATGGTDPNDPVIRS